MARLLHVQSSPRGARSHSARVAHTFLELYRRHHPADHVDAALGAALAAAEREAAQLAATF
ncbi:NAD(P)H-dependent oxidoreductase [Caldimonas brevitalea]|uniref:Uncharacterized protein n=1 Tax=Caldimonas brevitalea TaxID=413882 RepID=A0A0G3BHF1_9BURK|nr:NAD(P)H-dependent oxidoreductase [Caldimonas brevitalea]AKJ27423.1 hypothetical protein AAW51_0732 [Caldimonas brevitalea]